MTGQRPKLSCIQEPPALPYTYHLVQVLPYKRGIPTNSDVPRFRQTVHLHFFVLADKTTRNKDVIQATRIASSPRS